MKRGVGGNSVLSVPRAPTKWVSVARCRPEDMVNRQRWLRPWAGLLRPTLLSSGDPHSLWMGGHTTCGLGFQTHNQGEAQFTRLTWFSVGNKSHLHLCKAGHGSAPQPQAGAGDNASPEV